MDLDTCIFFDPQKPDKSIRSARLFGTPGYIAPEILRKRRYSPQSDFFSVGALAYYCMSKAILCQTVYEAPQMFFSVKEADERVYLECGVKNMKYIAFNDQIMV